MSDEETIDVVDETVDDVVEETTEESSEVEEPEETPEEPEETPAEEPEETPDEETPEEGDLDFEDWSKQFDGMPEGIKSEDDLAESYVAMLSEMKRGQTDTARLEQVEAALKARGFNGADGLLSGQLPPQQTPTQSTEQLEKTYFSQTPAMGLIEQMKQDGRLRDTTENPELTQNYSAMAQLIDNAIGPQLKKFEDVYKVVSERIIGHESKMRDLLWKDVPAKMRQGVDKKDIDALIDKGLFNDYTEAINFHSYHNMDALQKLTNKAEDRGAKKERRKLRRGNKAIRKSSKPAVTQTTYNYSKYQDGKGDWDHLKLEKSGQGDKIIDAWLKEHSS